MKNDQLGMIANAHLGEFWAQYRFSDIKQPRTIMPTVWRILAASVVLIFLSCWDSQHLPSYIRRLSTFQKPEKVTCPNIFANFLGAIIPKKLRPRRWPEYFILAYLSMRLHSRIIVLWKKNEAKRHVQCPLWDIVLTINRRIAEGARNFVSGHEAIVNRLPSRDDLCLRWMPQGDFAWPIPSACKWSEGPVWYSLSPILFINDQILRYIISWSNMMLWSWSRLTDSTRSQRSMRYSLAIFSIKRQRETTISGRKLPSRWGSS